MLSSLFLYVHGKRAVAIWGVGVYALSNGAPCSRAIRLVLPVLRAPRTTTFTASALGQASAHTHRHTRGARLLSRTPAARSACQTYTKNQARARLRCAARAGQTRQTRTGEALRYEDTRQPGRLAHHPLTLHYPCRLLAGTHAGDVGAGIQAGRKKVRAGGRAEPCAQRGTKGVQTFGVKFYALLLQALRFHARACAARRKRGQTSARRTAAPRALRMLNRHARQCSHAAAHVLRVQPCRTHAPHLAGGVQTLVRREWVPRGRARAWSKSLRAREAIRPRSTSWLLSSGTFG